jgi:deoxyinosine 3'endonuclease (endonuclease V)
VSPLSNVLVPLVGRSGALWGYAALTGNSTANPIFMSSGHLISPLTAARLTLALAVHRVVEPVRQADLRSRRYITENAALWG